MNDRAELAWWVVTTVSIGYLATRIAWSLVFGQ
jgi:hypothetical protein